MKTQQKLECIWVDQDVIGIFNPEIQCLGFVLADFILKDLETLND